MEQNRELGIEATTSSGVCRSRRRRGARGGLDATISGDRGCASGSRTALGSVHLASRRRQGDFTAAGARAECGHGGPGPGGEMQVYLFRRRPVADVLVGVVGHDRHPRRLTSRVDAPPRTCSIRHVEPGGPIYWNAAGEPPDSRVTDRLQSTDDDADRRGSDDETTATREHSSMFGLVQVSRSCNACQPTSVTHARESRQSTRSP